MKKISPLISFIIIATLLLTACGSTPTPAANDLLADVKARGTMKVATDPNYKPQSFLKPDGSFEGFDIEVANEIGKRLGVKVQFVTPAWDTITAGSWGGQWDLSVGSMTVTTDRQKVLNFVTPYYFTPAQFAASIDSKITSTDQISGQKVCVGTATTYEDYLKSNLGIPADNIYAPAPKSLTIVPLETDQNCAEAIKAGRKEFSIYLTSATVVKSNIDNKIPVVAVGKPVFVENLAPAIDKKASKDPTSFTAEVDKAVKAMHADGTLSTLSKKWFGDDLTKAPTK